MPLDIKYLRTKKQNPQHNRQPEINKNGFRCVVTAVIFAVFVDFTLRE